MRAPPMQFRQVAGPPLVVPAAQDRKLRFCPRLRLFANIRPSFSSIPHDSRIKSFRSEYRQDDECAERPCADARLDRDDSAELNKSAQKSLHEYVDHRPATNPVNNMIQ